MISFPPLEGEGCPMLGQNRQFQWFNNPSFIYPMVPASAATLLKKKGHNVIWNDCIAEKWNYEKFLNFYNEQKPDLISIETKTPVIKQHWKIINKLKEMEAKEKAKYLIDKFGDLAADVVDEILYTFVIGDNEILFWVEVKQEIENYEK